MRPGRGKYPKQCGSVCHFGDGKLASRGDGRGGKSIAHREPLACRCVPDGPARQWSKDNLHVQDVCLGLHLTRWVSALPLIVTSRWMAWRSPPVNTGLKSPEPDFRASY